MKHTKRRILSLLLALIMVIGLVPASVFAADVTIESVRAAILALSVDPSSYTADDTERIEAIQADFDALSAEDQAILDAETSHPDTGQPLGRVLETALWAVWSYRTVDNSTTLPDGVYSASSDPVLASSYSKGKSTSTRQKPWSVKDVTVTNGKAVATITVQSTTYTDLWMGGKTYPKTNTSGNCEFAGVPIDLNSTFYFAGVSSSMSTPISFSITSEIAEPVPVTLAITNNTNMFKLVSATAATLADGSGVLTFALSGTGYHNLFKGTYEEAVANGDARENWIVGATNADGKWEFKVPFAAGETYIPIVAISQSYLDKYEAGQNTLARAFYPRQVTVDLDAATIVSDDYKNTKELAVTNNVKMFKVEPTSSLYTVGGPNSNGYKSEFTLNMSNTTFDQAFIGSAEDAAKEGAATIAFVPTEDGTKGSFTFTVRTIKTAGDPSSVETLIGEPFVISFHSSKGWYERVFTIDEEAGTVVINPVVTVDIKASISVRGDVKLALKDVKAKDLNLDGKVSAGEAIIATHDAYYEGGAAEGFATAESTWGESITKLWGDTNASVMYYKNNESCWSLDDEFVTGDVLYAYTMKDEEGYSDVFAKMDKLAYTSEDGSLSITLQTAGFDADWNTVFSPASGATITVYNEDLEAIAADKYTVTDNGDGTYRLTFAEAGEYTIIATNEEANMVPALASVTVEKAYAPQIVVSFEIYDAESDTVALIREPEAVTFTAEDNGKTIAEKLLGAENVGITDSGWMQSFTVDEVEYSPTTMELENGSWLVYKNNANDSVGPADYKPADGDVYRFVLTTYDPVTYAMPVLANDMDALYWAAATSDAEDLTSAWALIQSEAPKQSDIDAMAVSLSKAGGAHYVLLDQRTVWVNTTTYPYTYIETLSVNKAIAEKDETVTVTIIAPSDLELVEGSLKANGVALTKATDTTYTFTMPDAYVSITAEFKVSDSIKLLGAVFSADEDGEDVLAIDPEFDKDVMEYTLDFADQDVEDGLFFTGTFNEGTTAKWMTYMEYSGYGFYTDGPAVTSGETMELSQPSFYYPGMSNGFKHRLDVTAASGTVSQYFFKMTMLPTLDTLEIDGEEIEDFEYNKYSYDITLPAGTEKITLNAVPYDEDTYYVYLNEDDEDIASTDTEVELAVGKNTIEIIVDDDCGTTNTYTLNITVEPPIELAITNNTGMFKLVTATAIVAKDGSGVLTFALSGTGYHNLFKGTYEEAVANGDARENWIVGETNADGKWEFKVPFAAGETYIPIVAISQSYLEKYENGQNPLARAFYPRQITIDLDAATIVSDDYKNTKELAVTNNVKMFKVEPTSSLYTVGGPNSNGYKSEFTLNMSNTTFDKAFIGSAEDAAKEGAATIAFVPTEDETKGSFTFTVRTIKTAGDPSSVETLIGEPFVISFHSSKGWYERVFTIDEEAGTVVINPVVSAEIKASISVRGDVKLALADVTVKDLNLDGKVSAGEAIIATHDAYYEGGAAEGFATAESTWGESITKLWGDTNASVMYYKNNESCWSLDDEFVKDDVLYAYTMKDETGYSDAFSRFDKSTYTSENGIQAVTLEKVTGYDSTTYAPIYGAAAGATITVYNADLEAIAADKYSVNDNGDGTYSLAFYEAGTFTIIATDTKNNIVPAIASVTVSEAATKPTLSSLAFKSSSGATAVEYELTPAFDPAVREYTFYLPDNATYAYAFAAPVEGSESTITLHYNNPSSGAEVVKTIGTAGNVYANTLAASNSFAGQDIIIKIDGQAAYTVHVLRQATLAAGTNGFNMTIISGNVDITPSYNRTVYEYDAYVLSDLVVTVIANPTVANASLKVNGTAAEAGTAVNVTPVWTDRAFDLIVEVSGEGAASGIYTFHLHEMARWLAVTKAPDKTVYQSGETFDPTGMEVTATYVDRSKVTVGPDKFTFSPDGELHLDDTTIVVSYAGLTAEQTISFTTPFDGAGTEEDPFQIKTAEDMLTLDQMVEGGESFEGTWLKMMNDITLDTGWNGVGTNGGQTGQLSANANCKPFSGNFDGGGHTLTIGKGDKAVFDFVRYAVIHNLAVYGEQIDDYGLISTYIADSGVTSVAIINNVTLKSGTKTLYSGFIGGYASGSNAVTISNSVIEEGVTIGYTKDQDWVGSFAGEFNGTITNCESYADVYGKDFVGGIVGDKGQTMGKFEITGCTFGGTVTATGNYVGGIAGSGYAGTRWGMGTAWSTPGVTIQDCTVSGSVKGVKAVGGIFGGEGAQAQAWENGPTNIKFNRFTGSVSGEEYVGGIIGYILSLNTNSFINGNTYIVGSAEKGIGAVGAVDTNGHEAGMFDGVYYFCTEVDETDKDAVAAIRNEVPGHALENVLTVTTLGSAGYKNQWKMNHHRSDDPLGADAEELVRVINDTATYNGGTLSLKDKISVNMYISIPDDAEGWRAVVYYEKDNFESAKKTYDLDKTSANGYSSSGDEYKIAYTEISAKEMTEKVRVKVYNSYGNQVMILNQEGNYVEYIDFSAADWANTMLADSSRPEKTRNLAMALLNYGGEAQTYFEFNTENNANAAGYLAEEMAAVTADNLKAYAPVKDANASAVGENGISLSLKSETYLNVYFKKDVKVTAANLNGAKIAVQKSGKEWVAKITGITAKNLGNQYTLTITNGNTTSTQKYSALSWAYNIISNGTSAKAIPLAKALYLYQQAAAEYFK